VNGTLRELGFGVLVVVAAAIPHVSHLFGLDLGQVPALVAGLVLVGLGVLTLVPDDGRAVAALAGAIAVVVAGAAVPIYVVRVAGAGNTLALSTGLAGVALLLAVAVVHVTAFDVTDAEQVAD